MSTAAKEAAEALANQVNGAFGFEVVKLGSSMDPITHWSTGILPLDHILDGGLPVGRFTEIYGDYSTLKSFAAYKAIGAVQKAGGTAVLVDSERAYDKEWAAACGVDTDMLLVQRPKTGDEAIALMEVLIGSGTDLVVWDSIAATQPRQYAEKAPGDDLQPGGQARMMSSGLRRLNSANSHTAILALNQTRVNVGMTYGGSRDSVPGGRAMPFYASYRLRFTKAGQVSQDGKVWDGETMVSAKIKTKQKIKVTIEKWKLNAPVREVWMMFDLRKGAVDETDFIIGWAMEQGYIEVKGAWYALEDIKAQGLEKFRKALSDDKEMIEWLVEEMKDGWKLASPGLSSVPVKRKVAKQKDES
jgi:recombination protein RecA